MLIDMKHSQELGLTVIMFFDSTQVKKLAKQPKRSF